jgi:hypothetical protein
MLKGFFFCNQRLYYTVHGLSWFEPTSQDTLITPETANFREFDKVPEHSKNRQSQLRWG